MQMYYFVFLRLKVQNVSKGLKKSFRKNQFLLLLASRSCILWLILISDFILAAPSFILVLLFSSWKDTGDCTGFSYIIWNNVLIPVLSVLQSLICSARQCVVHTFQAEDTDILEGTLFSLSQYRSTEEKMVAGWMWKSSRREIPILKSSSFLGWAVLACSRKPLAWPKGLQQSTLPWESACHWCFLHPRLDSQLGKRRGEITRLIFQN